MRAKITRKLLDGKHSGELWLWDTDVRGFYARHQGRRGSSWWYGVKYRLGGKARYHVMAEDGAAISADVCERLGLTAGATWSPEAARREAERIRGLVRDGRDPDAVRGMPTLSEFAARYLREHAEPFKKARSVEEDRGLLDRHILEDLGDHRLDKLDHAGVTRFARERKDTPVTANRCLALISHLYAKAAEWGVVPATMNPARGVPRFEERQRARFLTPEELQRLGTALRALTAEGAVAPIALEAIRFLALTGMRPSEVLGLCRDEVDFERCVAVLPNAKRGPRTVYLGAPALALLARLPRIEAERRLFPPTRRAAAELDLEPAWRLARDRAGLAGVRLYDLRHTAASIAVQGGASLYLTGGLLGHRKATTTQRYAHLDASPVAALAGRVSRTVAAALDRKSKPKPVTPFIRVKRRR